MHLHPRHPQTGNPRRSSRRSFLASSGAFGAAALLGGCGVSSLASERALGRTGSLNIINWAEYIDPTSIIDAERELQIPISYAPDYTDNGTGFDEIIEPALGANGSTDAFDIIVPTNWLAARMINN